MSKLALFQNALRAAEEHLSEHDPILRNVIAHYAPCRIRPHTRHFEALVGSIISQQLSTRVAEVIFSRFKALYAPASFPTAAQILATEDTALRGIGLSGAKLAYIKDLAARTDAGTLKLARIARMSDEEVIESLVAVKGIGVWTAHMFLIFSLGRLNILPVGDLGIRRAIERAYGFDALPNAPQIEQLAAERNWHPYCSVSSWYLWRSLENKTE